jgi:hypothetical protein
VKATPHLVRTVAAARGQGTSWEQIATLPNMPTKKTLLAWHSAGLIPDPVDEPLLGRDVAQALVLDPTTPPAVRAKAARDLEDFAFRDRTLGGDGGDGAGGTGIVNLTFQIAPPDTSAAEAREAAKARCSDWNVHAVINGYRNGLQRRACGCPYVEGEA